MNTMLKRVISFMLCIVLATSCLPVSAFAAENGETVAAVTTEATTEPTQESSEETEAPSESTEEQSENHDRSVKAGKPSKKDHEHPKKETEPSTEATEPSTEAAEPSAEATVPETTEATVPETTEATVPETTEQTVPETTEATVPETTEATVPETTEETVPENALMLAETEEEADPVAAALEARANVEVSSDALTEAKAYIDGITINNSSNDPAAVVGNFGTHFTWDNEKRESNKSYLFDWSYYNGVVFEGLEYLYEVTGKQEYYDYVVEYMSSLITSDGTWASCTNDTSKQAAGYNSTHGADCYKTASLLLDAYEMTGDSRYLTMAATLYADLDTAAKSYSLANAGSNYRHTWASDPSPDLWLDGLYMILPFRAEYAKYIGDTEELDLIVSRMQWVSDNMYDEAKGLFYHAADSAASNSGTYWLRSIGWYAAAMADIMDSMSGENLEAMKTQLKKLVDGMLLVQNSTNGMWLNNMNASQSSSNPYETSGTALVCYAVMKAVNEGWLDESYADMAILAFNGICSEKLSGSTLTDICFKGAPGSSNSTFYDNEGKGVGPFIMLYAEVEEYVNGVTAPETPDPDPSEPTEPEDVTKEDTDTGVTVTAPGITGLTVTEIQETEQVEQIQQKVAEVLKTEKLVMLDIAVADFTTGSTATVVVPIPDGMDSTKFAVYYVPTEGEPELMPGKALSATQYEFTTTHFSTYVGGEVMPIAEEPGGNTGTGNLVGGIVYTLDTDGVTANKKYLIVNTSNNGTGYALTNNNNNADRTEVTISGSGTNRTITVDNDSNIAWKFSGSTSGTVGNNGRYVYPNQNSLSLNTTGTNMTISSQSNGAYRIYRYSDNYYYYLHYNNSSWTGFRIRQQNSVGSVYLYELTSSSAGEEVTFTVTPDSATIQPDSTVALTGTVTVAGETVDLSNCTITWASANTAYATVSNGTVTGVADGTANITATLSAVNGTALQENIVLTVPVTVASKTVTSVELVSKTGTVYVGSAQTVRTGAQIKVTYSDGSTEYEYVTVDMLTDSNGNAVSTASTGSQSGLTVTYGSKTVTGFTLNVVEKPDMNYPEYPDPGSIDVDKYIADYSQFQNTGVAEIELTTSGLPAQTGVDVILVTDLSNSMAREVGATSDGDYDVTKLDNLKDAVESFADTFLGGGEQNTISLVTFGGYDEDHTTTKVSGYADSTQTLLVGSNSADAVKTTINNIQLVYTGSGTGFTLSFDGGATSGQNYGNTNYDHAFMETYSAVDALKAQYLAQNGIGYDESGREIYILFMTDGAPSNYNGYYYNYKTGARADVYATWTNTSGSEVNYQMGSNNAQYSQANWYNLISGNNLYWANQVYAMAGVENIINIGFDLANGGFASWVFTEASGYPLEDVLENLVTDQSLTVYSADDAGTLTQIYAQLASELKLAATNAYFVDQMGGDFKIQMASTVTKFKENSTETETITLNPKPQITISTQAIYTPDDVGTVIDDVTVTTDMIGKTYGEPTVQEIVTFNDAGTEAYSNIDVDGDGATNDNIIDANGVIVAEHFWYNTTASAVMIDTDGDGEADYSLPAETFYWNIGTINNQKFTMSYYVYLEGSAEGTKPEGTYATNNYAKLYYTNWLGNDAYKDTESPSLAWDSASVYYGFYLVDKNGNPVVNRATGATGSFEDAVKVTSKIFYDEVYLNEIETFATISVASTNVPDGYKIYDNGATYTIKVNSDLDASGWTIVNTATPDTTYVTDYYGDSFTNVVDSETITDRTDWDYTSTTVWFAVVWEPSTVPDVVVIDYGLPVDIDVIENDMFGTAGTLIGLGDVDAIPVTDVNKYASTESENFGITFEATYGDVSIVDGEARYTPRSMEMPTYDKFAYEALYTTTEDENQYYYGDVTVIPATTIYYEDAFITFAGNNNGTVTSGIAVEPENGQLTSGQWYREGTTDADATQAEDRPGYYSLSYLDANNIYGYDGAYAQMSERSLDSAVRVHVDANSYATANFSFYGTGFDVISLTSNATGTIVVQVYKDGTRVRNTLVDTYYGMEENGDISPNSPESIYQVPVIKISGMEYAKYDVTITATYNTTMDHTDAEGYDLYLDAIRIYDPAGTAYGDDGEDGANGSEIDDVIEDAYIADGEGYPVYTELRNNIIAASNYTVTKNEDGNVTVTGDELAGAIFIDCNDAVTSIVDYVSYGPNNELYLATNQAIAFNVNVPENVADIQLGIKMANGNPVTYEINDDSYTVSTATDMYYSILKYAKAGTVTIKNVSGGILSLTNIKVTHASAPATESGISLLSMDAESAGIALMSLRNAPVIEEEVPETTVPETTAPETTVPEETEPEVTESVTTEPEETVSETTEPEKNEQEQIEEAVKEAVQAVVKTVVNTLKNIFSKWFR